jgi:hypothetical protein
MTSIVCPQCDRRSFNRNDVEQGFCGNCHEFTHGTVTDHTGTYEWSYWLRFINTAPINILSGYEPVRARSHVNTEDLRIVAKGYEHGLAGARRERFLLLAITAGLALVALSVVGYIIVILLGPR